MLTGSHSNVHPRRYGGDNVSMLLDEQRDETVFSLIDDVLERDLPLFAICRGFQEVNVALGGKIEPRLHEHSNEIGHREDESIPFDQRYGHVHEVQVKPGGIVDRRFAAILRALFRAYTHD